MTRLRAHLDGLRARGETAMGLFLTAGFPSPGATLPILQAVDAAGADFIELGMPFSDPVAEGLPIQQASERALAPGRDDGRHVRDRPPPSGASRHAAAADGLRQPGHALRRGRLLRRRRVFGRGRPDPARRAPRGGRGRRAGRRRPRPLHHPPHRAEHLRRPRPPGRRPLDRLRLRRERDGPDRLRAWATPTRPTPTSPAPGPRSSSRCSSASGSRRTPTPSG